MNKTKISAEVVADSVDARGNRLTSLLVVMPRIIIAEINTHRMLSKNTSSSRAIPFEKMVEAVQNDPFIPIAWQKHHSGMQGNEYITDQKIIDFKKGVWINNMHKAVKGAKELYYPVSKARSMTDIKEIPDTGVTKQLCNRLLEPFMWTTMLITGSKEGWDNLFSLRCPRYLYDYEDDPLYFNSKKDWVNYYNESQGYKEGNPEFTKIENLTSLEWLQFNKGQAEIHMQMLAESIYDAMNKSTPKQLQSWGWHIPFEDTMEVPAILSLITNEDGTIRDGDYSKIAVKISTAMAARTSYTVVGEEKEIDYAKMIELHDRLIAQNPPHSSPMEHCCICVTDEDYNKSFKGEVKGWFRNYKGFKSYRQIIEESK